MPRTAPFTVPKAKPKPIPEPPDWYFTPDRSPATRNVQVARTDIEAFRDQLHAIHPALDLSWHPIKHQFILWARNPRITHEECVGWQLVVTGLRLDKRGLAFAASRCARHSGEGRDYIRRVTDEMKRDQAAALKAVDADDADWRSDRAQFWKIKNIGKGSKGATYHW